MIAVATVTTGVTAFGLNVIVDYLWIMFRWITHPVVVRRDGHAFGSLAGVVSVVLASHTAVATTVACLLLTSVDSQPIGYRIPVHFKLPRVSWIVRSRFPHNSITGVHLGVVRETA